MELAAPEGLENFNKLINGEMMLPFLCFQFFIDLLYSCR